MQIPQDANVPKDGERSRPFRVAESWLLERGDDEEQQQASSDAKHYHLEGLEIDSHSQDMTIAGDSVKVDSLLDASTLEIFSKAGRRYERNDTLPKFPESLLPRPEDLQTRFVTRIRNQSPRSQN